MPIRHLCLQKQTSLPLMNPRISRDDDEPSRDAARVTSLGTDFDNASRIPLFFCMPRHTVTMRALPG